MNEPTSPLRHLWRYCRTRGRNAWRVLQTKGLRGVWRNFSHEIMCLSGRYTAPQTAADYPPSTPEQPVATVPDSAFINSRKVVPPSPRPTRLQVTPASFPDIDRAAIGQAIGRIKGDLRHSGASTGRLPHDDQ